MILKNICELGKVSPSKISDRKVLVFRNSKYFVYLEDLSKNFMKFVLLLSDNVTLHLDGVLYFRVVDPYKVNTFVNTNDVIPSESTCRLERTFYSQLQYYYSLMLIVLQICGSCLFIKFNTLM